MEQSSFNFSYGLRLQGKKIKIPRKSGAKKRKGFLRRGFCKMYASLDCGTLSAHYNAGPNILGYFLFSWAWHSTLQKPPFTKTPFSWLQEGTNVHFSNVHFVLCQALGLNPLTPPFHAFFPPPPLCCFHTKWIKVGNHEPREGSSNAEISPRTKCTFERCTFVLWSVAPPKAPRSPKQIKWPKSDSKVTLGGRRPIDSKKGQKWLKKEFLWLKTPFWATFDLFWVNWASTPQSHFFVTLIVLGFWGLQVALLITTFVTPWWFVPEDRLSELCLKKY